MSEFVTTSESRTVTAHGIFNITIEDPVVSINNDIKNAQSTFDKIADAGFDVIKNLVFGKKTGFATGGIAKMVKSKGEDGIAMVRNGEGLIAPEHVQYIQDLMTNLPQLTDFTDAITKIPDGLTPVNNTSIGDISFSFGDINGVSNPQEFVKYIQTDAKVQRAIQSVSVDQIAGKTRLGVRSIK